ncbi:MAG: DUF4405 domain-containing protein [Anaerolineae bacterium]
MNKPTTNYWVDVVIGAAFIISGISGAVFLLPAGVGSGASFLGLSIRAWSDLHTWSSLVMIAGVGVHLVLHWRWVSYMTKRKLRVPAVARLGSMSGPTVTRPSAGLARADEIDQGRRAFLRLGGAATVATGLLIAGYRLGIGDSSSAGGDSAAGADMGTLPTEPSVAAGAHDASGAAAESSAASAARAESTASASVSEVESTPVAEVQPGQEPVQAQGVACRFGIVDDPYPGRCRHYVDSNGDGICDHSVLGSGTVSVTSG